MEASSALVAFGRSREAVEEIAVNAVMAMVPNTRGVRATIYRGDEKTMTIFAAAGHDAEAIVGHSVELQPEAAARLLRGEPITARDVPAEQRAASTLPAKLGDLYSAPLLAHGDLTGVRGGGAREILALAVGLGRSPRLSAAARTAITARPLRS